MICSLTTKLGTSLIIMAFLFYMVSASFCHDWQIGLSFPIGHDGFLGNDVHNYELELYKDTIAGSHFNLTIDEGAVVRLRHIWVYIARYSDFQEAWAKCAIYNYSTNTVINWTQERLLMHGDLAPGIGNKPYQRFDFENVVLLGTGEYWLQFWHDGGKHLSPPRNDPIRFYYIYSGTGDKGGFASYPYPDQAYSWPDTISWDDTNTTEFTILCEYDFIEWQNAETWWGAIGSKIWHFVEQWWGYLIAISAGFSLGLIRTGLFLGGLIMTFSPMMYIAKVKTSIGAENAVACLLITFIGIGLLIGFAYL